MSDKLKGILKRIFKKLGYTLVNNKVYNILTEQSIPYDMEDMFKEIYLKCKPYTMTTVQQCYAMYKATEYIIKENIPGDIVECGVWRGGSTMISGITLLKMNEISRTLYLYDTFKGMSKPTDKDIRNYDNRPAIEMWNKNRHGNINKWDYASLEEVKRNLYSIDYPQNKIKFIKGKVEETISNVIPEKISLLRLDTDLYESTYHELIHLYPKLSVNGILIIDDYGYWKGQKEAVDQYFNENKISILLNRIGDQGRIGLKIK